jgi:hypothetical protein
MKRAKATPTTRLRLRKARLQEEASLVENDLRHHLRYLHDHLGIILTTSAVSALTGSLPPLALRIARQWLFRRGLRLIHKWFRS